jgi:YegS/Rv2252/BmrU family lipid kinase
MRVKLIANPVSGRGKGKRLIHNAVSSLKGHGLSPDISFTGRPGDAAPMARRALGSYDAIAGLGGDGTMNEIASALRGTGVPLAVYPAGTGNDLIKTLGKDLSYDNISSALAGGSTALVDMGLANGRPFVNVFGIGLDAAVTALNARNRFTGLKISYVFALASALARYRQYPLSLHINGEIISANALSLCTGNGPVCGGVFRLTPDALVDDGLLDITLLSELPLRALPFHIHKAFNGRISETPYTRMFKARKLSITSEIPLPAHMDGEVLDPYLDHYDIEILPGALTVIRP